MRSSGTSAMGRALFATRAMATRFELVLAGSAAGALQAAGEAALREIESCEQRFSLFQPASLLSHIHRCAGRSAVRLDRDSFELFELMQRVYQASGGAFDPTVGAALQRLGLHQGVAVPAPLEAQAANFGMVELDPARQVVCLTRPDLRLDLGGIAKGHALDLALRSLREAGVECAFLQGGTSSVLALGAPPNANAWSVELGASAANWRAELRDCAFSYSARSGRTLPNGTTHIVDPRSGACAEGPERSAVIAPSAAEAEAWSTALLVQRGLELPPHCEALLCEGASKAPHWRPLTALRSFVHHSSAALL